jgi:hypothetical protein
MGIDTRDRDKIEERTRGRIPAELRDYDFRLHFENAPPTGSFSFLALGDSGSMGPKEQIKFEVARMMAAEQGVSMVLHLGDVVYLSGSADGYRDRFILPYKEWLVRGKEQASHVEMLFKLPFLPVYGNHDYYDVNDALQLIPIIGDLVGDVIAATKEEIGRGSKNGKVFEEAFVASAADLVARVTKDGLPYVAGEQTRIPNRYYWFTFGPCAFFALDSNTLDGTSEPAPGEKKQTKKLRKSLKHQVEELRENANELADLIRAKRVPKSTPNPELTLFHLVTEIAELEKKADVLEKFIEADEEDFDADQLAWLEKVLQHPDVQGKWKIVYMHHPLYSSEESHTDDPEAEGLRTNLRRIFVENGVHLVLAGHSHCFEWVAPALPADGGDPALVQPERKICYVVSGGGGRHLRPSILDPALLKDERKVAAVINNQHLFSLVAESKAYAAVRDDGAEVFHYLRVDVTPEEMQVAPVGVVRKAPDPVARESPLRVKQHIMKGNQLFQTEDLLDHVSITRDAGPQAVTTD